jgi:phospholipase C
MSNPTFSRRQVLAGGVAGAAALGMAKVEHVRATGAESIRLAAKTKPAGTGTLADVKHVVFLMQENRSFDHYFGTMKGVAGFNDTTNRGAFTQNWPGGSQPSLLPFHMNTLTESAECTSDLSHEWTAEHSSWNNGAMDSFVSTHTSSQYEGAAGTNTMGYYKKADIPFYFDLAKKFTVCDHYHCSVFGPTHPNRLMAISGTLDPAGVAGGPILTTESSLSEFQGTCSWTTMPEVLQDAGISWKHYNPYGSFYQPGASPFISKNMLLYFNQFTSADTSSDLYKNAFSYYGPNVNGGLTSTNPNENDFAADVASGNLPQVSWIISPDSYDEHPPAPPALGEWYTQQILDTLTSNPEVWASTVLFVMYDENDGFFDHISPPVAPPGTPGEYVTVSPLPTDAGGVAGPIGLGVRVPMIVVSPFSAGGWLCSDVFDHTSQLRFLETVFGVTAPNITDWRRQTVGDLTATLPTLTTPNSRVPHLPVTSDDESTAPINQCSSGEIIEGGGGSSGSGPTGNFPVARHQKLPKQSPGTLKRTPA